VSQARPTRRKQVVIHGPGDYRALTIEEQPIPSLERDDVLIEVEAIGINYADCIIRMGLYESAKKYVGWPITPGFEVAGRVLAVGPDVSHVSVGDDVIGVTRFGGYTTHLVTPAHQVFPRPRGWTASQAAGFPSVFLTAYYALFTLAAPQTGQRMLVHSAAGGVGGALLQLGTIAGCDMVGVVGRPHKIDTAHQLGATQVIDKSTQPLWQLAKQYAPDGYHAIFDANGVETLQHSYQHLASPGRLVIYGFHTMLPKRGGRPNWFKLAWSYLRTPRFNPLDLTGDNRSVMGFNLSYLFHETDLLQHTMNELLGWIEEDKIQPAPLTEYPFEKVAESHRDIESGQTVGKLILCP
jgi:NADPH:quinone reductase-like Zn-dependent oxidoreductase